MTGHPGLGWATQPPALGGPYGDQGFWFFKSTAEMQLFKKMTFKIQGQGHGWRQSSKSQCESNILLTHIPFVPCQSGIPLLSYDFFKTWPWNSRVKVMDEVTVQSQNVGVTSYRLKVMSEVKGQGHILYPVSNRCTSFSFHINRTNHSWDMTKIVFDLEKTHPKFLKRIRQNQSF